MALVDEPADIREGEELNRVAVEIFLKDSIERLDGPLAVKQFPS